MIMVHVPKGVQPCQVDDFPEGCERSRKGSIHFRTNSTVRMTEDEYNHVVGSAKHSGFGARLIVVHKGEARTAKAEKAESAKTAPKAKPTSAQKPPVKESAKEEQKATKKTKSTG